MDISWTLKTVITDIYNSWTFKIHRVIIHCVKKYYLFLLQFFTLLSTGVQIKGPQENISAPWFILPQMKKV